MPLDNTHITHTYTQGYINTDTARKVSAYWLKSKNVVPISLSSVEILINVLNTHHMYMIPPTQKLAVSSLVGEGC